MSEEITLTLPISTLVELRCFLCEGYLSCSPVRLLPNGNCICGCCSPLNTDHPLYRVVAFEAMLSKMSFPCVFKKYGCTEKLLFGETADHKSKCDHKPIACPSNTSTACSWEGSTSQLLQHFKDGHPDFLKDRAEFKLDLDKDVQGVFMMTENSLGFVVKYFYNANERILKYDVRFCTNKHGFDVLSKIQLISGTDANCNINLKISECSAYDENFSGMQNAKVLNLNKFLECLSDPDCILVAFLQIIKSNGNNVTNANDCKVNFELIKTLKCYKCQNYLLPPLFDLDSNNICYDCGKDDSNCTLSNNQDLLNLVNETVYPCRWRECKFMGKNDIFKGHVMNCQFRQYCCVYSDCYTTFKLSAAVDHLRTHKNHNALYIADKIIYKTSFAQNYPRKDILTIKNKRIIVIEHRMINSSPPYAHKISLYQSSEDYADIRGIVDFEHEHCTLKSKEFHVSYDLEVTVKDLPPCFKKTDQLTVTLELITE